MKDNSHLKKFISDHGMKYFNVHSVRMEDSITIYDRDRAHMKYDSTYPAFYYQILLDKHVAFFNKYFIRSETVLDVFDMNEENIKIVKQLLVKWKFSYL